MQDVLIIGNGGREHALAWKIAQSPSVRTVYVAPGNAGTASEIKCQNVPIIATDIAALVEFAQQKNIGLTIPGPEAPLALGLVDAFSVAGLLCFGPSQFAAQLESSKRFSKEFMQHHGIPTARFKSFQSTEDAKAYVAHHPLPIVIKASGLAAGKGVVIAKTRQEAEETIHAFLTQGKLGEASNEIVIEEFLTGEEASFMVLTDGVTALALATSQDHKTRDEGNQGPNTGGMGAYSPALVVTDELHQKIMREVIEPTLRGMQQESHPFVGFLYAGLMISESGDIKVLEFNCRLGDPETEVILMRLQSDLLQHCLAALEGHLAQEELVWDARKAVGVVLTAGGYPEAYQQGYRIQGLTSSYPTDIKVFHAGTKQQPDGIVTAGGRVLCVVAKGNSFAHAQQAAYKVAQGIQWQDIYYRRDIGYRAILREIAHSTT